MGARALLLVVVAVVLVLLTVYAPTVAIPLSAFVNMLGRRIVRWREAR